MERQARQVSWLRQRWRAFRALATDLRIFASDYSRLSRTGTTTHEGACALRQLFVGTNGRFNDSIAFCNRLKNPPYPALTGESVLGPVAKLDLKAIVHQLDAKGFFVFPTQLTAPACDELTVFASQTPFRVLLDNFAHARELRCFDPAAPVAVRYDADPESLLRQPAAQKIVVDPGFLAISQAYFRAKAVQDMVAMWWSTANPQPSSAAAQLYHFDMDRIKFLKFFIYLTDVGSDNGPHMYVAGSHRRLPSELCVDRRFSDEEVHRIYPPEQRIEITGRRGTICVVDTRGLHKGKPLVRGHRLILQIEFAINLLGYPYPKVVIGRNATPDFIAAKLKYPYTFQHYDLANNAELQTTS